MEHAAVVENFKSFFGNSKTCVCFKSGKKKCILIFFLLHTFLFTFSGCRKRKS
jgi:hypothetical protein